jgi:hypothetical protein
MDRALAEAWIRGHVRPVGAIQPAHQRPWATVLRVPLATGVAWFKACAPVQAFEPQLTAALYARWPDRVAEVLAHDQARRGCRSPTRGPPPRGRQPAPGLAGCVAAVCRAAAGRGRSHPPDLTGGVPDLRVATLPGRYEDLLQRQLPLAREELGRLRGFRAAVCGTVRRARRPRRPGDGAAARRPPRGERLRPRRAAAPARLGRRVDLAPVRVAGDHLPVPRETTSCRPATRGSGGCATPIWSRGVAVWAGCSRWRCVSGCSRTRSRGCGSGTTCRRRHARRSTGRLRSCCGARSRRPSDSVARCPPHPSGLRPLRPARQRPARQAAHTTRAHAERLG